MPIRKQAHVHNLVYETARELCLAEYEVLMANNQVRMAWKAKCPGMSELGLQAAFLKRFLRAFVAPARATLAVQLTGPLDEASKETIHRALIMDNTLVRGRNAPHVKVGP